MKKAVAEFIGTFALIFIGVVAIAQIAASEFGNLTTIAFAHGLTIATLVSATMVISGGHLNPAVTLGLLVGKQINAKDAGVYVVAQLLGGIAGGYLARAVLPGDLLTEGIGVPALGLGITVGQGILLELILTFFLVFVVYGTGVDERFGARIGGLAIGLTVALDIMAGGPLTGAAMNPARWLGAAVPAGTYADWIVYWVGPLSGGALAGLVYGYFLLERPTGPEEEPREVQLERGS